MDFTNRRSHAPQRSRNPPNGAAPSLWTMARSGFVTPPTCSQSSGWKQHYRAKDRSSLDLGSRGHGIALELILSATERRALPAVGAAAGDRHPAEVPRDRSAGNARRSVAD